MFATLTLYIQVLIALVPFAMGISALVLLYKIYKNTKPKD